jgi:hypothetical protein
MTSRRTVIADLRRAAVRQLWLDASGHPLEMSGGPGEGGFVFLGRRADGALNRTTWSVEPPDGVRQVIERSEDDGDFWSGQQDGRRSRAMLDLLDGLRLLRAQGADVRVVAFDPLPDVEPAEREEHMALRLAAARRQHAGRPTLADWELLVALSQQSPPCAGLVTTDNSMLLQERELAVLLQTKLTLVVADAAGDDPLKATGLLLTHLPWIARQEHRHRAQVWVLRSEQPIDGSPRE